MPIGQRRSVEWGSSLGGAMPRLFVILLLSLVVASSASAVTMDWTFVGNPGNAGDNTNFGHGAVGYSYNIGTYEATNAQYAEFLNARRAIGPDSLDPFGLYSTNMDSTNYGGITRSGVPGLYTYTAIAGRENMPVNYVSFYDALRFANWLHNGGERRHRDGCIHSAGRHGHAQQRHNGDAQRGGDDLPDQRGRVVQ